VRSDYIATCLRVGPLAKTWRINWLARNPRETDTPTTHKPRHAACRNSPHFSLLYSSARSGPIILTAVFIWRVSTIVLVVAGPRRWDTAARVVAFEFIRTARYTNTLQNNIEILLSAQQQRTLKIPQCGDLQNIGLIMPTLPMSLRRINLERRVFGNISECQFLPHDAMVARSMLFHASVSLSVRPSVTSRIASKRLDESSWFLTRNFPSTCHTLCYKEIWVSPKIRARPSGISCQTATLKISPRQVDRVVNKTRRRRRRPSLLTTPMHSVMVT